MRRRRPLSARSQKAFDRALTGDLKNLKVKLSKGQFAKYLDDHSLGFANVWARLEAKLLSNDPRLQDQALLAELEDRFVPSEADSGPLRAPLTYAFYDLATSDLFSPKDIENQTALLDLRYPNEWYPKTRTIQRTIHVHVGPTNSGKTYHALKRLEGAETGVYAGPLRLLANEVYTRMNDAGRSCVLVTGDEIRAPPEDFLGSDDPAKPPTLASCTVEMVPTHKPFKVAVIDEIQMLGSVDRGWAWTQALLATEADEVHVCGEARTVPLLRSLCALAGDKLVLHEYKRLSPLAMDQQSLNGNLSNLAAGDCIVCFSVVGIHTMRKRIEQVTKKNVAVVYGSLPPETRAHQASLFNDPNNDYDYLVASDAIGMGLNL